MQCKWLRRITHLKYTFCTTLTGAVSYCNYHHVFRMNMVFKPTSMCLKNMRNMSVGLKESIVKFLLHFLNLALFHLDYCMSIVAHGFPPEPNYHKQCCVSNFRKKKTHTPSCNFSPSHPQPVIQFHFTIMLLNLSQK